VDLREFQAELRANAPPVARVRLAVRLVRLPERTVVASFAHETQQTAGSSDIHNVVLAFDEALGAAMRRVVEWTLRTAEPRRA
jgi:cholesterol transport system auxiliary component